MRNLLAGKLLLPRLQTHVVDKSGWLVPSKRIGNMACCCRPEGGQLEPGVEVSASPMKILVVDDDKESRDLLCELLSGDYAVHAVENVAAARRELGANAHYRIVIADLRMPGGTGLELLRDLSKQESKPEVILMSSFMSGLERKLAVELGAGALLEKPFRFGDLLQAVADLAAPNSVGMLS
jgi:CheY-like chemotaxis protein